MSFTKPKREKHLSQRVDNEMHYKLHYISKYYGRSANGQLLFMIRRTVEQFQRQHGPIQRPKG